MFQQPTNKNEEISKLATLCSSAAAFFHSSTAAQQLDWCKCQWYDIYLAAQANTNMHRFCSKLPFVYYLQFCYSSALQIQTTQHVLHARHAANFPC